MTIKDYLTSEKPLMLTVTPIYKALSIYHWAFNDLSLFQQCLFLYLFNNVLAHLSQNLYVVRRRRRCRCCRCRLCCRYFFHIFIFFSKTLGKFQPNLVQSILV